MADKKITQLNNITGANLVDADEFVVVDISADETKAITLGELKEAFDAGSGFVRVTGDTMTGALDVQSTITADGLTVDGGSTSTIRITGQAQGSNEFSILEFFNTDGSNDGPQVTGKISMTGNASGVNSSLNFYTAKSDTGVEGAAPTKRMTIAANGNVSFYEDTGTTPKFFWDASAEALGIGTTSVTAGRIAEFTDAGDAQIRVSTTTAAGDARLELIADSGGVSQIRFGDEVAANPGLLSYTHSNNSMTFGTNGVSSRMTIDSSGYVGINYTNPSIFGTVAVVQKASGKGIAIVDATVANTLFLENNTSQCDIKINTTKPIVFSTNNAEAMRIDSSGRVGIGVVPSSVLHVKASTPVFTLQATAVGNAATPFISGVDSNSDVKWRVGNLSTGTPDLFISSNGGGTRFTTGSGYTEAMRIDYSGKVGIGTASPAHELSVVSAGDTTVEIKSTGTGDADALLILDSAATGESEVQFFHDGVHGASIQWFTDGSPDLNIATVAGTDGVIDFQPNNSLAMRIDSSGNVGIGTAAPSAKLHVLGSGAVPLRWGDTSALGTLTYSGSDPIIQSNTGNMLFYSSGTETMRLTPANLTLPDLGATTTTIGVADAASNYYNVIGRGSLILKASSAVAGSNAQSGGRLVLEAGNSYNGQSGQVYIRAGKNLVDSAKAEILFQQGLVESARFSPKRSLLLGTAVDNATFTVQGNSATSYTAYLVGSASGSGYNLLCRGYTTTGVAVRFLNPAGADVGSIDYTASATSYTTSSDYRLKTDAQPMTGASARVQALNPVNFEWIASGDRVDGFLAHEAQSVVPESVTGTKDAMMDEEYEVTAAVEATYDDDGNELTAAVDAVMGTRSVPDYQGIDQSKLVPLLTAALQEALTKIDDLETRLSALEG